MARTGVSTDRLFAGHKRGNSSKVTSIIRWMNKPDRIASARSQASVGQRERASAEIQPSSGGEPAGEIRPERIAALEDGASRPHHNFSRQRARFANRALLLQP